MTVNNPPYALQNASHSAALFRQAVSALVNDTGGVVPGTASGSYVNAKPIDLAVTQQGTPNMSVLVNPGQCYMPGSQVSPPTSMTWSSQASYFSLNDAQVTVTIATADPVNPRIDSVYYVTQDSYYSGSNNQAVIGVVTGTPAPSPSAPAIPANGILLAYVAVAANATSIVNANITDKRIWAAGLGGVTTATGLPIGVQVIPGTPSNGTYSNNFPLILQAGVSPSLTTNSSAQTAFTYPSAFPNGVMSIVVTTNNDTYPQWRVISPVTLTAATFVVRKYDGTAAISVTVGQMLYFALGW
jgi:hypothetical protein